jgi:homoserine kinase type II
LAQFHLAAQKTPLSLTGTRSIPWVLDYMPTSPTCSAREIEQFQSYQARIQDLPILLENCPKGWVHGDLFPDNAFFTGQQLSGVIDFNNACTDYLLLDLCITLNAWSSLGIEHSCPKRFEAMLSAYTTVRPLTEVERHAMPKTLLAAALRFWASRIDFTRDFGGKKGKEPAEYQRLAAHYVAQIES